MEERKAWGLSIIRKSYFLQVKSLILVGTLEKICVLDSYYSNSICGMI
ncbi:hypothetical protein LBBP_02965 [Leptospira borgpetersenii serovar Ballum]|uniref:Uncharacterized protein n=1 Tax=Leptospira borgpetersenii serovar Ballum TaxID=280505 RepID=A0A0S2IU64_LEPBO|nr:hypothetical protein LBBP_02965 [Leptospira borgpetersenii serovar Ballum]